MLRGAPHLSTLLLLALGLAFPFLALGFVPPATAGEPMSPVIGVIPAALDFAVLCPGVCQDLVVALRNAVDDPQSRLVIAKFVVTPPFVLVNPPGVPLIMLGDGTHVNLFLRYCAAGSGPQMGSLTIYANATNSPLVVPLSGIADPPPQCAAGGQYFGQPNHPITFDGSDSSDPGGAIVSYTWDFGDGATGTGPTPTHAYVLKNTYVVGLTVADGCGSMTSCQTTSVVSNNLSPLCDAGGRYAGFTGKPIAISGAGSIDPDGTIVDYRWDFGEGQTGTGVAPSHIYAAPGLYTVSLTVFDDQGAYSSCSTTAEVDIKGDPNAPPKCDAAGPYRGAVGRPVTFDGTDSHDPDGIVVAYTWDFGDGATATGATPSHSYSDAGFFTVSLHVTDDDGATSTCSTRARSIDLSPDFNRVRQEGRPPVAGVSSSATQAFIEPKGIPTCDAGGPYSAIGGEAIAFDGTGSSDPAGQIKFYSWRFGDCGSATGSNPTHA
jgi:PKD repeat protein